MRTVRRDLLIGGIGQLVLLGALSATVGLSGAGWAAGVIGGIGTALLVSRGLRSRQLGPADRITYLRAVLVVGLAALVVTALSRQLPVALTVSLSSVVLALDGVDGWVARRTGTTSAFGARFDMEVDAFGILVLSAQVARSLGAWVLLIGAARYLFAAAGWILPWLRAPLPVRYWRKPVAAIQGIALTVAIVLHRPTLGSVVVVALALALLAESFGRDVRWLWLRRAGQPVPAADQPLSAMLGGAASVFAVAIVWVALVAPDRPSRLLPVAFLRVPLEGVALLALALMAPAAIRKAGSLTLGLLLGLIALFNLLDLGYLAAVDRPFNPVSDWASIGPALGVLRDSVGADWALVVAIAAGLLVALAVVVVMLSVSRVVGLAARHRRTTLRTASALGVVWLLAAVLGVQAVRGAPVASTSAARSLYRQVNQVRVAVADQHTFQATLTADDPISRTPTADLLAGLRGKDVILAFVESYGRVALQDLPDAPRLKTLLQNGTQQLAAAGFESRSAYLTSPTFGGISWLAHSTLQSGLWIDSQLRYNQLVASQRYTLSDAFKRAGWRTVADDPSNNVAWPEGTSFYHYDQVYNAHNVGYVGPNFSYAAMPDQYVLGAFQRLELDTAPRRPVMAEIDLVSSHTPWAPLPRPVAWDALGDGSVFDAMPAQGQAPTTVWRSASRVRLAYERSIEYTMSTVISFVQRSHDKNLVLVVLGDHQPATIVSGSSAGHDVPVTIIAQDPAVLQRVAGWHWQAGLLPDPSAPVSPMDSFRDRFLDAFAGSAPPTVATGH